ncbi:RusA family crossover junction endodeoxyribonuclease [Candidatus Dojkabacteria bacterium]|jgi:crossover junction endodeoxyribonuclease RusA|nr:RusA family crossover junction endodeoxyribonuclease [Candidatus Dojkabacteria bacterium]
MSLEFTLKGNPLTTNTLYGHTGHRRYMTHRGKELKESYQWQIKSQYKSKPLKTDIDLRVELFFGDNRVRDIDNYNKILLDAFTGILWEDDSQIVSLLIVKNKDIKNPRIEIQL